MIAWHRGQLIPANELPIPAADRALQHGIGLFETMRTWQGRPRLLDRHLHRLFRSAAALGLDLDPASLPGPHDVSRLIAAAAPPPADVLLRLTATGGLADSPCSSAIWITARPLPDASISSAAGWALAASARFWVDRDDRLARHKTLNYWARQLAWEDARREDADEALTWSRDNRVWEGTRSNLFLVQDARLLTPPLTGPVLPGIMRSLVIERARDLGIEVLACELGPDQLEGADEVFLTNAVRAIQWVRRLENRSFSAPGPVTNRLIVATSAWLDSSDTDAQQDSPP